MKRSHLLLLLLLGLGVAYWAVLRGPTLPRARSVYIAPGRNASVVAREDSIRAAETARMDSVTYGGKAFKIHRKHPDWPLKDCVLVASRQIWIGMKYEMLVYSFGKPDHTNVSNYGSGDRYQYCWHDLTPSCYYDNNGDGIIDAYN